jgi:RND family efflux transporter MFP subunit
MHSRRHPTSFLLFVNVLCSVAAIACGGTSSAKADAGEAPAKSVQVEQVHTEEVRRAIDVVGTLAAEDEVIISAEVEGRVRRLAADLGDHVQQGQVLVELDYEKLQYALDQQKAAYARALASFGATAITDLPPIERTPDVQRAQAELVQAKQSFERAQQLSKRELVAAQTLDDADAMLRTKQANYDLALQNAKNLRADIDASAATVALAERRVRDATIRAPFEGYVQQRLVSLGEYVKAEAPVMRVVRVDPLKVTAEIPERMAPWVAVGQPIALQVDAYADKTIVGKISRISPAVTQATRAFAFEALVPNGEALLKPGTFARVHIETSQVARVATVSYGALQYRYGMYRAFVVDGDKLASRELKVGERVGDRIEVLEGVKPGERIAVSDVESLTDGMTVSVAAP